MFKEFGERLFGKPSKAEASHKESWQSFEINGLKIKPINVEVSSGEVLYGLLLPDNVVFVPVNSRSPFPVLERMKEENKKYVAGRSDMLVVKPIKDLLNVPNGGVNNGCWTAMQHHNHLHSTGIEFILEYGERINPESLFQNLHQIFPHLTFSKGSLPK